MKTDKQLIDRFEEGLRCVYRSGGRPEDRVVMYLGAGEAIRTAMELLPPETPQQTLLALQRIGDLACDEASRATGVIDAMPWWRKIVRFV